MIISDAYLYLKTIEYIGSRPHQYLFYKNKKSILVIVNRNFYSLGEQSTKGILILVSETVINFNPKKNDKI